MDMRQGLIGNGTEGGGAGGGRGQKLGKKTGKENWKESATGESGIALLRRLGTAGVQEGRQSRNFRDQQEARPILSFRNAVSNLSGKAEKGGEIRLENGVTVGRRTVVSTGEVLGGHWSTGIVNPLENFPPRLVRRINTRLSLSRVTVGLTRRKR